MSDTPNDELRLRATEAQMRRALGLHNTSQTQAIPPPATPNGNVPYIHNVGASSGMARFLSRSSIGIRVTHPAPMRSKWRGRLCGSRVAAREHAEHLLQEAQATIHDLQTKLAHERLARDEALQRADSEKQVVEQALQSVREELAAERDCRQKAEQERDDAIAARQEAEERMREVLAPRMHERIPASSEPARRQR